MSWWSLGLGGMEHGLGRFLRVVGSWDPLGCGCIAICTAKPGFIGFQMKFVARYRIPFYRLAGVNF